MGWLERWDERNQRVADRQRSRPVPAVGVGAATGAAWIVLGTLLVPDGGSHVAFAVNTVIGLGLAIVVARRRRKDQEKG